MAFTIYLLYLFLETVSDKDSHLFCDKSDDQRLILGSYNASLAPLSFKYFERLLYFLRQKETIKGK